MLQGVPQHFTDIVGKRLDAITVYKHCLEYLINHLLGDINNYFVSMMMMKTTDLDFVLTIRTRYENEDKIRMIMQEAAKKVNFPIISCLSVINKTIQDFSYRKIIYIHCTCTSICNYVCLFKNANKR